MGVSAVVDTAAAGHRAHRMEIGPSHAGCARLRAGGDADGGSPDAGPVGWNLPRWVVADRDREHAVAALQHQRLGLHRRVLVRVERLRVAQEVSVRHQRLGED